MTRDALRPGLVALLLVLAGCAGPVVSPGPAGGGGPSARTTSPPPDPAAAATPTSGPSPTDANAPSTDANATLTAPNTGATDTNATPPVDPAKVLDHEDIFSDASRQLVADVVAAGGTLTREGGVRGLSTFYDWPYVNYRGACYEISSYSTILFVKSHVRFALRAVDASAVENESVVVAYADLPAIDRQAVDEGLPPSHEPGRIGESTNALVRRSIRYGGNDTVRHVETSSVVTDYRYVQYRGEYYELTHLTRLHTDLSEVLSTTVVADRISDEPCPTD